MSNRHLAALSLALALSCSIAPVYAETKKCAPVSVWKTMAAKNGGTFEKDPLTAFKFDFAKKLYAVMPPAGPEPKAEQALEINFTDGSGIVLFISHGAVCNSLLLPSSLHKRFDDVKEPVPGELHL